VALATLLVLLGRILSLYRVTLLLANVVATRKISGASPSTGNGFRNATRPHGNLVAANTHNRHFNLTGWMWLLLDFNGFWRDVPRSNWFEVFVFDDNGHGRMASHLTGVIALSCAVFTATRLHTFWAVTKVTTVGVVVVAFGGKAS
jgi:hypothetical protein